MEGLYNLNDFAPPWLSLPPLLLAAALLWKFRRIRDWSADRLPGISIRTYGLCLFLGAIVTVVMFAPLQPIVRPWGGADGYFTRAINLVQSGVYGYGNTPSAYFPPGYSFVLAPFVFVFGSTPWSFIVTNLVLLLGSSIAVRGILLRLGAAEPHANLVATVLVLIPNHLFSTLLPFSDAPFALLWMLAFGLVLVSNRHPAGMMYPLFAGLCAGIAALTRSQGVLLLLPLIACVLAAKGEVLSTRLRRAGLILAAVAVVITPWIARNYSLFGKFVPVSTNGGFNLAIGHNPTNSSTWNPYADTSSVVAARMAAAGGTLWNESQRDSFYFRLAIEHIEKNPTQALARGARKIAVILASNAYSFGFLNSYTTIERWKFIPPEGSILHTTFSRFTGAFFAVFYGGAYVLNGTLYYILFGLTILFLWNDRRRLSPASLMMLLLIVLVCMVAFAVFGLSRYKEPMGVVMLVYIGIMIFTDTHRRGVRAQDP